MIVVLGSINLDLGFAAPRLPAAGETVLCDAAAVSPGGKGANQALAAARDGAAVRMIGAVGRDAFAAPALSELRSGGVDISGIVEVERPTGLAAVMVDPAGQNQIMVASGANLAVTARQIETLALGPDATLVLQMEIPPAEVAKAIEFARTRGSRIVLNLAPAATLAEEVLARLDVLIANEIEIARLGTGRPMDIAHAVARRLGITVIVTLGGDGACMAAPASCWQIGCLPVEVVDTTGAGDAFVGVFAAALDRGASPESALHRASVAGALTCTRFGAQSGLPGAAEIDRALSRLAPAVRAD
ncbi:ribokinase [Desertibaculum subflavum]|uniref:ribokinase n=1 Tax=Desertibaculum subflavum TaxID=2268458 RepID=UPI000E66F421